MTKESPVKSTTPPTYKFKVNKEYSNHNNKPRMLIPPRRKAVHNFYEFQKKCLELSADYYQGIANLMRETDVTLFISPLNQGDPLQIINETGMVISGMLNPPSTAYSGSPPVKQNREISNNENVQEPETSPSKQTQRNKRAPRQLWGEEEVARLKASFTKYQGDWEAIIKEFEPDRTRIQIFQKARQIGLRAVEAGRIIDMSKQSTSAAADTEQTNTNTDEVMSFVQNISNDQDKENEFDGPWNESSTEGMGEEQ